MFKFFRILYPRCSYNQMAVRYFDKKSFPKYKGENAVTDFVDEYKNDFPKLKRKNSFTQTSKYNNASSKFKDEHGFTKMKDKTTFSKFLNSVLNHSIDNAYSETEDSNANLKNYDEQVEYIKSVTDKVPDDWISIKNNVLSKSGSLNQKNIDAVMIKYMIGLKHMDSALSFAQHLRTTNEELSLGAINGLLYLYTISKVEEPQSQDHKDFILKTYKQLYDKYKVLDFTTAEKLLHALCAIGEWEKAIKVLSDIHISAAPTHSAYSTVIATLFKLNKKKKALEMIEESVQNKRPLQYYAYIEWMDYILRKYKDKRVIAKHLEEIYLHIRRQCAILDQRTANKLKEVFNSLEWTAEFTRIRKHDGQCNACKQTLNCLPLSSDEFNTLQQNVKDKLIVGSDLFLKTSPEELKRFSEFLDRTAPYDIVVDALNVSYAAAKGNNLDRLNLLNYVVDHFVSKQKKILVLGRRHMLRWHRATLEKIKSKACTFFTEDLSQDDPYFITASILSGAHTDIVSKDLLRGHKFVLKDESLRNLFKRWQWQHQWMIFLNNQKGVIIQPPLTFTPCAQTKNDGWHLPFEIETGSRASLVNDGTPDLSSWLCLRPKI